MKKDSFKDVMFRLGGSHGIQQVFSDFLTLVTCALSNGAQEQRHLNTINKYNKQEANEFATALGLFVSEMAGAAGMVDVLGNFYQENISRGHSGRFFTPQPVCDLMARFNLPHKPASRIFDPACSSGRMLMAWARYNRTARFYGADDNGDCAKMAAVNLCLNGLFGEIAWMNSRSREFCSAWEIRPHVKGFPFLVEIPRISSFIYTRMTEEKAHVQTIPFAQTRLVFEL